MSSIKRLNDWIAILSAQPKDEAVALSPSEVLRLLFDLQQTVKEQSSP